ncbi:MAG: hypothetical protein HQL72_10465 [Magnetococcales bacterium]|nr:hypothetical protein [Magnetococcales bacterium]
MHTSTQRVRATYQGVPHQPSYPTDFCLGKEKGYGYRNGLLVTWKKIHDSAKRVLGRQQSRCPDNEVHHPSVCQRGWRGEICSNCPSCGI